ncbi:MAG: hypothetical protein QM734_15235 [Cyclobacteriaceae bacterium]
MKSVFRLSWNLLAFILICLSCSKENSSGLQASQFVWTKVSNLSVSPVRAVGVFNSNLIVSCDNIFEYCGSVLISSDNGSSWINGDQVSCSNSFATNGSIFYAATYNGIFKSTDGVTWEAINNGLSSLDQITGSVAAVGNIVFVGTYNSGILKSIDTGNTWTTANNGLSEKRINSLVLSGDYLFAGTDVGIFYSKDQGGSWTKLSNSAVNHKVLYLNANDGNIYASTANGFYISTDNGLNWNSAGPEGVQIYSLAFLNNQIIAGTNKGIFISGDAVTWSGSVAGMPNTYVSSLTTTGTKIYAGTGLGLFISEDNGQNWSEVNIGLIQNVESLTAINDQLFAGVCGGAFRSTDDGNSWVKITNGLPTDHEIGIHNITVSQGALFATTSDDTVYVSKNSGDSWAQSNVNNYSQEVIALNNNIAIACTNDGQIIRSTDFGNSWDVVFNCGYFNIVTAIAFDGTTAYIGLNSGQIFSSLDNGINWKQIAIVPGLSVTRLIKSRQVGITFLHIQVFIFTSPVIKVLIGK